MPELIVLGKQLGKPLNRPRRVTVELPELIVRAIHCRVDEAPQLFFFHVVVVAEEIVHRRESA